MLCSCFIHYEKNRQIYILMKCCAIHIRNVSFQSFITSFYGTQMFAHFDTNIQDVYTAWSIECGA